MRKFFSKYKLFIKIIIAIIIGFLIGSFMPSFIIDIFIAVNILIGKLISFCIPFIVLGFVIKGISSLGKSSGKLLLITVIISYTFMLAASLMSYLVSKNIFPLFLSSDMEAAVESSSGSSSYIISQISNFSIPPIMDVMSALVLSFIIGIGIAYTDSKTLKHLALDFHDIVNMLVQKIIVPLLPIYVIGMFAKMSSTGQIYKILGGFSKVIIVIITLHISALLVQYIIAGIIAKKNPLVLIKNILPAYFSAIATQSSVAVIPITMKSTIDNDVSEDVADFVIPLCSTIHLTGSIISITCSTIAMMIISGKPIVFSQLIGFMLMLAVITVAAPGVPCGAILAVTGILQSMLGFDSFLISLMISLHVVQDGFGTACNISGDGAIAVIIDVINKKLKGKKLALKG